MIVSHFEASVSKVYNATIMSGVCLYDLVCDTNLL